MGSYQLVEILGRGGMGEVWRAEHVEIRSQVAIKLVLAQRADRVAEQRFFREATATAKVRHPGIVSVTDYGQREAGGAYLVMELLHGEALASRLQRGALRSEVAIELGLQIAEALAAAHDAGVIHRDLKPANIFLVPDAAVRGGTRAKLVDFGIAKELGGALDQTGMTASGALVGTPLYMAPEQMASRHGEVDHRVDLYALGLVLYEMVVGVPPFRGPSLGDLFDQHVNVAPSSPRILEPTVPAQLELVILKLLAKSPLDRPASAHGVASQLAAMAAGAPSDEHLALDETVGVSAQPSVRRWRRPAMIVAGVLVAAGSAVAIAHVRTHANLDYDTASDAVLGQACHDGDGRACLLDADRAQRVAQPDLNRVFSQMSAACDSEIADGCEGMAEMYLAGAGVRVDAGRGREIAERQCRDGHAQSCRLAGDIARDGYDKPADARAAYLAWSRGCELENAEACRETAIAVRDGIGIATDESRVKPLVEKARTLAGPRCAKDDAEACATLASVYGDSDLGSVDLARAAGLATRACELGNASACWYAGTVVAQGQGVTPDPERGIALMQRACNEGLQEGCGNLGLVIAKGMLGPSDVPRGVKLATRACEVGGDRNCVALATLHALGLGVTQDPAMAAMLTKRACAAGNQDGCLSFFLPTLSDPNIKELPDAAGEAGTRACDLGNSTGCWLAGEYETRRNSFAAAVRDNERACKVSSGQMGCSELAMFYLDGRGVAKDPARGRKLLDDSCELGVALACYRLGDRLLAGNGLAQDDAESMRAFAKGCDKGLSDSCLRAADLVDGPHARLAKDAARAKEMRARACTIDPSTCPKQEPTR